MHEGTFRIVEEVLMNELISLIDLDLSSCDIVDDLFEVPEIYK